jgi:hypothetical protein
VVQNIARTEGWLKEGEPRPSFGQPVAGSAKHYIPEDRRLCLRQYHVFQRDESFYIHTCLCRYLLCSYICADPVAAVPKVRALSLRALDRGFESRFRHGCLPLVSVCRVVLYRYRARNEPITRPRCPTVCRKLIRKALGWGKLCKNRNIHIKIRISNRVNYKDTFEWRQTLLEGPVSMTDLRRKD